jgi:hypothetical protein
MGDAYAPGRAERAGFTHLIGYAKSAPDIARRLETRVRRDYPDLYARCVQYADEHVNELGRATVLPAVLQEV